MNVTVVACTGTVVCAGVRVPNAGSYAGCGTIGGRWLAAYARGSRSRSRARSYGGAGVPVTRNWSRVRVFGPYPGSVGGGPPSALRSGASVCWS